MTLNQPSFCYFCGNEVTHNKEELAICPKHGILWALKQPGLCADALIIKGGQILLIQRNRQPFLGCWAMPGGFQKYGEHPAKTVIREVAEETGLTIIPTGLLGIYLENMPDRTYRQITVFLAEINAGTLQAGDDANQADWFNINTIPDNVVPYHQQRINDYIAKMPSFYDRSLGPEPQS
ncbi:MAG TPA: NUDIX hydrolase [Gammaproteobacteria bacterium]|nr:NUDIX hydrolase [Gammaproteobacteria bacterium]